MDIGIIKSWIEDKNVLTLIPQSGGLLEISFADDDILRIRYTDKDIFQSDEAFILNGEPDKKPFTLEKSDNRFKLSSEKITVEVTLDPFTFKIKDIYGNELLSSTSNFLTSDGIRKIVRFNLRTTERIYGLGQDPMANLNQRNKERRMWQQWGHGRRSGNGGIPFMMSSEGYAVLLNSPWPSRFAVGEAEIAERDELADSWAPAPWPWEKVQETAPDKTMILLDGGDLDLFIICRPRLDDLLKGYAQLTGYAPMLPKWALGFMQCKNRYRSQQELLSIARTFRERKIPCDVLIIDWLWFKEFGDLEWFKKDWPDPEGMLKQLASMGFKVLQAQHPFVEKNSLKYEKFKEAGFLNDVPEGARPTFDHTNPEARKAWWNEIKRLYQQGIRGYWTDMGEIEQHLPGTMSFLGPREKVHNIYSLMWTKGLYDGQRSDFNERVFSLPRTVYAGIQKYGAGMWSGDIDASWEVLKDQVVIGQGVCLSGQQYWTTDVGGFFTGKEFTPELYVRWFEWGAFCPLFRTHGTRPGNEPWSFGEQVEKICTDYIKLRYRLMPYIYSCARKVTEEGRPIMRAMCMDFSDDPKAVEMTHQFMFGPSILVSPVLERGARKWEVYLPQGQWYDFWSGKLYQGKTTVTVPAPLDVIPLFVKSGSIIPMEPAKQHVGEENTNKLILHIYPGPSAEFELYEDDGKTYDYEKGQYAKTTIKCEKSDEIKITIMPAKGSYKGMKDIRDYEIVLHHSNKPLKVEVNDSSVDTWDYCEEDMTLKIQLSNVSVYDELNIRIISHDTQAMRTPEEQDVKISADVDTTEDGVAIVTLAMYDIHSDTEHSYKVELTEPYGWAVIKGEKSVENNFAGFAEAKWYLKAVADALPLISRGLLNVEIDGKAAGIPLNIGSGYATRWSVVGSFDNIEDKGLDITYEVESNPDAPFYTYKDRHLAWQRLDGEFNCFGYVDLRKCGTNVSNGITEGVAYAKCKVWSSKAQKCYIQISSEKGVKVWLNGKEVLSSKDILINEVSNPVELDQGWNTVMIKCTLYAEKPYSGREFGFNFRIIDEDGQIMEDLLYKA